MFIVYMVLFLLGLYLFGLGITAGSGLIFVAGLLSVSAALALIVHMPGNATRRDN